MLALIEQILLLLMEIGLPWAGMVVGTAIAVPIMAILFLLSPWVAGGALFILTLLLLYHSVHRGVIWAAWLWGVLLIPGTLTAIGAPLWGPVPFAVWAIVVEGVALLISLVPGVIYHPWAGVVRLWAIGSVVLFLLIIGGAGLQLSLATLLTAGLLFLLSWIIGASTYRPYEVRRLKRRISSITAAVALITLLWQPVIIPFANWVNTASKSLYQGILESPLGSWYSTVSLRLERIEIGEASKTEALRSVEDHLTDAHKRRWENLINQIPEAPASQEEWRELEVPQDP